MLAEDKETSYKEAIKAVSNTLLATQADKDQLELNLKDEIKKFAGKAATATFFKVKHKKEAERLAGELTLTQTSLKDANDKATNEKTQLLADLKAINDKIGNTTGTLPEEINQQIDAIKARLDTILEAERGDAITVLEKRQADNLTQLQNEAKILNEHEKKALDYAAGYYYFHSNGQHDRAKADKEKLDQHLTDHATEITNTAVLYTAQIVKKHFDEEEKHNEDNHKYLKDITDINNKYTELEQRYKDKEAELVDAGNKLTLTEEQKKKISDNSIKTIGKLQKDFNDLSVLNSDNYKAHTQEKNDLIAQVDFLKDQLKQKKISESDLNVKFNDIQTKLNRLLAKERVIYNNKGTQTDITGEALAELVNLVFTNLDDTKEKLKSLVMSTTPGAFPSEESKALTNEYIKWIDAFKDRKTLIELLKGNPPPAKPKPTTTDASTSTPTTGGGTGGTTI